MKLLAKSGKIFQFLFILLIIVGIFLSIFYPEKIKYEYSIKYTKEKKEEIEKIKNELIKNEKTIESKIDKLHAAEFDAKKAEKEAASAKDSIDKEKLKIHIPSILISLEQNAIKRNVKLLIEYNQIETFSDENVNVVQKFDKDQNKDKTTKKENNIEDKKNVDIEIKEKDKEKNDEVKVEDEDKNKNGDGTEEIDKNKEIFNKNVGVNKVTIIPGIYTTMIPIEIFGSYDDVRDYFKYIDSIDFLEPSIINLFSKGDEIEGYAILQVFHEGGV